MEDCRDYLEYRVGKFFIGTVSISVLGEIFLALIDESNQVRLSKASYLILANVTEIIDKQGILLLPSSKNAYQRAVYLSNTFRIDPTDALHLAIAEEDPECRVFVTLDRKLLEDKKLQEELGIQIKHPREFRKHA